MSLDNIKPLKAAKRSFIIRFLKRYTEEDYKRRLAKTTFELSRLPTDNDRQRNWETEIAEVKKIASAAEAAIALVDDQGNRSHRLDGGQNPLQVRFRGPHPLRLEVLQRHA